MLTKATVYVVAALSLALLCACGAAWWFHTSASALGVELQAARNERAAAAASVDKCRAANTEWQGALSAVKGELAACVQQTADARAAGAREVAQAQAAAERVLAESETWRLRFSTASHDPDCAKTLEALLCPAVSEY